MLDSSIFAAIYGLAYKSGVLDAIGRFSAENLQYVIGAGLLLFWFWPAKDRRKNRSMIAASVLSAGVARGIVKTVIIFFVHRARPYVALGDVKPLIGTSLSEAYQSFPSGHAIFFFALASAVWLYNKKLGAGLFVAALIMGVARVFVGVHWPTDILGGLVLGVTTGVVVTLLYERYLDGVFHAVISKIGFRE